MRAKRQDVWLFDRGLKYAPPEYGTGAIVAVEVRLNHFPHVFPEFA
jgi:hypothetical protein